MKLKADIKYGRDSQSQMLDLYFPENASKNDLPLVMFIHGGGFSGGDKAKGAALDLANANNQNFVLPHNHIEHY